VFTGSASGIASGGPASAATSILSGPTNPLNGVTVAGAGDVNGDGYADVIVGSQSYSVTVVSEGAAFVFLGSPSGIPNATPQTAATTLRSNESGSDFGWSVASAGDVNGDGYGDVIVGAYQYGSSNAGAAFVFDGSATGVANGTPATANTAFVYADAGAQFGYSVAGAGDVNGDGYADIVLSGPHEGVVLVYHGSPAGLISNSSATSIGQSQLEYLGLSVARRRRCERRRIRRPRRWRRGEHFGREPGRRRVRVLGWRQPHRARATSRSVAR
jgi:hypothetical protein